MKKTAFLLLLLGSFLHILAEENYITNIYGRDCKMLNGK